MSFIAVVLYATTAVYFAGVMVRLMLTLTPVVCILAAIAFSVTLDNYLVDDRPSENKQSEAASADADSSSEENDKKKRKDLYDKVCASLSAILIHPCLWLNGWHVILWINIGQNWRLGNILVGNFLCFYPVCTILQGLKWPHAHSVFFKLIYATSPGCFYSDGASSLGCALLNFFSYFLYQDI